ncbi:hypothetical protein BKA70DRAFT_1422340 [Coprinopsis sp. MPI-PUGE-AT-0042]|nr:hypothetical protein BKA70DRAFT_1422340 [Coprinopsis sp. MPI-PUGE-AT-0042]
MSGAITKLIAVNFVILGVFLNTYLYGLATFQYASYATTKFKDPLWIKATVLALFALDTLHSSSLIWMIWVYAIEGTADFTRLLRNPVWAHQMTIALTAIIAFLTQFFLSYRTYRLTKAKVLFGMSIVAEVGALTSGIVCTVRSFRLHSVVQLSSLKPYIAAWLISETITDLAVCGLLLWTLARSRTGFTASDTVVKRLMRGALQTGCFAGIFAVITLILFLTSRDTQLFSLTGIPISRLYSNTLMDTILCRGVLREIMNQSEPTHNSTSIGLGSVNPTSSIALQIHKEVDHDTGRESFQVRSTGRPKTAPPPGTREHKGRPSSDLTIYPIPSDNNFKM